MPFAANISELQIRISGISEKITRDTIVKVEEEYQHRLGYCLARYGAQFEKNFGRPENFDEIDIEYLL